MLSIIFQTIYDLDKAQLTCINARKPEIRAHLFASATGSDANWIVKLIDFYPQHYPENWEMADYQLMISNEVFRGRYLESFKESAAIEPNAIRDYNFSLHTQIHTFKKGLARNLRPSVAGEVQSLLISKLKSRTRKRPGPAF